MRTSIESGAAGRAGRRGPGFTRAGAALASGLLAWVAGCGSGDAHPEPGLYTDPPSIVLVTIDTLRADHLGCYGYHRDTSPRIDQLAAEGVFFERASAVSGTTLPSHLSIHTALLPHQHGYTANLGAIKGAFAPSPGRIPLALLLQQAGWKTAAFVSGTTVKRTTGIHAGFTTWNQPTEINRVGAETTDRALAWIERYASKGRLGEDGDRHPFFLWVHYWDVHEPNTPPEPYASAYQTDAALRARLAERRVDVGQLEEGFSPMEKARMFFPELREPLARQEIDDVPALSSEMVERLHNLYDGDILYVDTQVGRLLDALTDQGLVDETIICVTADHGQSLGEHDWLEHGRITVENVHVPLVMRFPGDTVSQPRTVQRMVSGIDVLPTIISRYHESLGLESFLKQATGEDTLDPRQNRPFAFAHRSDRERDNWEKGRKFGLTFEDWKYYRLEAEEDQLYHLASDPLELEDVAAEHPERVATMRKIVERILQDRPAGDGPTLELSAEERAALQSELQELGYMGGDE